MTDISESGIEAALDAWYEGRRPAHRETTKLALTLAIQAYLPFHPPASREEGLREAAKAITDLAEEWKRHDGTLPRIDGEWPAYMAKVVLRLIPTKPEAKEPREVSDEIEVLRRLADGDALAYSRDGDNCWFTNGDRAWVAEATVIAMREKGYLRRSWAADDPWGTDGISDAGRAALQSKKPE